MSETGAPTPSAVEPDPRWEVGGEEWLVREYHQQRRSVRDLADEVGLSYSTLRDRLERLSAQRGLGLRARGGHGHSRGWTPRGPRRLPVVRRVYGPQDMRRVADLYAGGEGASITRISEQTGIPRTSVRALLARYGVPLPERASRARRR